jgi:hypothetical protein
MIYFLNRGLILEQEIVKALKKYFSLLRVPEYYKNFTVTVTNEHPFARMFIEAISGASVQNVSLFPVVVVATEEDSKPSELSALALGDTSALAIEPEDIAADESGKSFLERRYEMITPAIMAELRAAMDAREDKRIYGATMFIRRRDHVSVEIWAENPQLKNELYEWIRLFVCGFMREYLADIYKSYFGITEGGSPLVIFDSSVHGQRSNNFNIDFGIELSGAHITFDADYVIEQSMIDTEIVEANNFLMEVVNHVRDYDGTTREWIFGDDGAGGDGTGGAGGTNGAGEEMAAPEEPAGQSAGAGSGAGRTGTN